MYNEEEIIMSQKSDEEGDHRCEEEVHDPPEEGSSSEDLDVTNQISDNLPL